MFFFLLPVSGIRPPSLAWEADALPPSHCRSCEPFVSRCRALGHFNSQKQGCLTFLFSFSIAYFFRHFAPLDMSDCCIVYLSFIRANPRHVCRIIARGGNICYYLILFCGPFKIFLATCGPSLRLSKRPTAFSRNEPYVLDCTGPCVMVICIVFVIHYSSFKVPADQSVLWVIISCTIISEFSRLSGLFYAVL